MCLQLYFYQHLASDVLKIDFKKNEKTKKDSELVICAETSACFKEIDDVKS